LSFVKPSPCHTRLPADNTPACEAFVACAAHFDEAELHAFWQELSRQPGEGRRTATAEDERAECEMQFVEQIGGGEGT
jgi:hypothetical protein